MNPVVIATLARAAPAQWAEFVAECQKHADKKSKECVEAPPDMLPIAQGRAQNAVELVKTFTNAVKTADRISAQAGAK